MSASKETGGTNGPQEMKRSSRIGEAWGSPRWRCCLAPRTDFAFVVIEASPRYKRPDRRREKTETVKLESVIQIDAPPDVVWAVTVDLERWPEWTPTTQSVKRIDRGPLDIGSAAIVKQPGLPEARWVVSAITPGERVTRETRIRGIRMIATHQINATPTGAQSVLRVELRGLVARLLWPLIGRSGDDLWSRKTQA